MEYLPKLQINLQVQLQEINYLGETMALQINQAKLNDSFVLGNENAIAQAVYSAFQENGYICTQVFAILNWNIPGPYFGKSFCKAYLTDREGRNTHLYQADIPPDVVETYLRREKNEFLLEFNNILNSNVPVEERSVCWLKQSFDKIRAAISNHRMT